MDEDWDDETPAWERPTEQPFDGILALKQIIPLAEFLSSASPSLTFKAVRRGVELDGDFRFETIEVEGFDEAYAKVCYHRGNLVSVAVCHIEYEMPQIILHPPDLITEA